MLHCDIVYQLMHGAEALEQGLTQLSGQLLGIQPLADVAYVLMLAPCHLIIASAICPRYI